MHTCFIDMEAGTFVAKAMVTSFLENYDKSSINDVYADMYFTMYMNQVPYQLESDGSYMKQLTLKETEHMVKPLNRVSCVPLTQLIFLGLGINNII